MKMVSAAKLRGDQDRLENGKPFGQSTNQLLPYPEYIFDGSDLDSIPEGTGTPSAVMAVISSDKGLCGGINAASGKGARNLIARHRAAGTDDLSLFVVGIKGENALKRTAADSMVCAIDEIWRTPMNFAKASAIATSVMEVGGDKKEINIVYNVFKSAISYETTIKTIPNFSALYASAAEDAPLPEPLGSYDLEPEVPDEAIMNLTEFVLATNLYGCCLENATSEQSARMSAMENASKNATEMIDKLTTIYNRARQAKITTELIEIISGAESLKQG